MLQFLLLVPLVSAQADPDHWAYKAPSRPPVPRVGDAEWIRTPIDAFILSRLEAARLSPSPPADRRTYIRRLCFDLLGLPPTMEQVEAFVGDRRPGAHARLVDRLLSSPAYGERWGRHWLDVARYADTKGYLFTEERRFPHAHTYRDWVIDALNRDMPYDRFIHLQIAADLVNPEDPRDLAAMGFITVGRRFLNKEPDIIDDRIDVISRGLLGLTVNCARCHDHKYDPIPTADYYSLYGVFANSSESRTPPVIGIAADPEASRAYEAERLKLQASVDAYRDERIAKRHPRLREAPVLARYLEAASEGRDGVDSSLMKSLSEKYDLNTMLLANWFKFLAESGKRKDPLFQAWHEFASIPRGEFRKRAGRVSSGLKGDPRILKAFAKPPKTLKEVAERYGRLLAGPFSDRLKPWGGPFELDSREGGTLLPRNEREHLRKLRKKVEALAASHPGSPPRAMVLEERSSLRAQQVFIRGNAEAPGDRVPRQFLAVLAGPDRKPFMRGSGRLELAQAIAAPSNPLTARVIVNRMWQHHFGAGLVTTSSDLGMRSDAPSHPGLLDWLAIELVDGGWSLKRLHRMMVLSSTYRQSSGPRKGAEVKDPRNRLLWRMNRHRLEWEPMRDAILAVSGELDRRMGGRGSRIFLHPSPPRRTVYGYVERQNLPGTLRTFDFASPDIHVARRHETNVPQQALFMMNSPFLAHHARELAARAAGEGTIRILFRLTLQRDPSPEELAAARKFLERGDAGSTRVATASSAWSYGFGEVDEATGRLKKFHPLPHFSGEGWQGGPKWPDRLLGWIRLTAEGGHAGEDLSHATVRRWTAPSTGTISIEGSVAHETPNGDGVRARILFSRTGELASWVVHNGRAKTEFESIPVQEGDTLDFVIDRRATISHDSFSWAPIILQPREAGGTAAWSALRDFSGPPGPSPSPMTPLERFAQALLMTNEFLFVD